ncbi:hypothetical protein [Winogradskyella arenosi]|uniref:Lipocalin-like protein n=1 Tax=Winogradskyella arenosi TaxID=533325 RepID=A0A368ZEQ4_9FLAO|nr:hypothetical protein [Winogradskyella arenosi]RCW92004.1 hypothetical protein DFQ08_10223 [Winogradskyella arenosi]
MKNLICILVLTFALSSCSTTDDETAISNSDLVGSWQWTQTAGGLFYSEETPETTGKELELSLTDANNFSIAENGTEIANGTYALSLETSIYSGETARFITLETIDQQDVGFVKNGIIKISNNNQLKIADNNYDGFSSSFIKME